jgi:hypothetical protein
MYSLGGKDRTAEEWTLVVRVVSPDLELGNVLAPYGHLVFD